MVDIIIILILILWAFIGYKRGFLKGLTGIASLIVSVLVTMCLFTQMADFLKTTAVYETIYENIEKSLISSEESESKTKDSERSSDITELLLGGINDGVQEIKDGVVSAIVEKTADIAIKMLSAVIVFLVVRILTAVLVKAFGIVRKLPLIGIFDGFLGAILGVARGFFTVYIVLMSVAVCVSFNSENVVADKINQSEFAKVMYNNNIFLDFVAND